MEYLTAIHEAGHAAAAEHLGLAWELHPEGNEDYIAFVRVLGCTNFYDAAFIKLCGPYAEVGYGEILMEDYHWDDLADQPEWIKDLAEVRAETWTYENWSRIVELADMFMEAHS